MLCFSITMCVNLENSALNGVCVTLTGLGNYQMGYPTSLISVVQGSNHMNG